MNDACNKYVSRTVREKLNTATVDGQTGGDRDCVVADPAGGRGFDTRIPQMQDINSTTNSAENATT